MFLKASEHSSVSETFQSLRGPDGEKAPDSASTRDRKERQPHARWSLCLPALTSRDAPRPLYSHPSLIALLLFVLLLLLSGMAPVFSSSFCSFSISDHISLVMKCFLCSSSVLHGATPPQASCHQTSTRCSFSSRRLWSSVTFLYSRAHFLLLCQCFSLLPPVFSALCS